jgi:AcrR family transcriptional regulator
MAYYVHVSVYGILSCRSAVKQKYDARVTKPNRRGLGRGLELLWGQVQSPSRGPKPALTVDEIARAAIDVADHQGIGALSMRQIAEQLGFTTMSLYRYVPSKDELLEVMRDVALADPPTPRPEAGWRAELTRWAHAAMARHHEHPWMLEMEIRRPPFGPNHLRWLDAALQIVSTLGLAHEDELSAILTLDSYTRGAAAIQVGMAREQRRVKTSAAELDRIYARIFETVVSDSRYPALAKLVAAGVFTPKQAPRDEFQFGLERVLDGIEVLVEIRRTLP